MDMVVCPHCKTQRLVTSRVPKDVIVVMPCPSCQELSVLFRHRVIALNRRVLERGSFSERKNHLAEVIAHFLEAGIFPLLHDEPGDHSFEDMDTAALHAPTPDHDLISEEEVERFTRIELKRLDNPVYFRRHFG
jgi:hypothetical protein